LWELPFLSRRLQSLGVTSTSVADRMDYVYSQFAASGGFPNVWLTWFRDLILDFGELGALFAVFVIGVLSGNIYLRCLKSGRLVWVYLLVGINLVCAYSFMVSIISDTLIFFYFVFVMVTFFRYDRTAKHRARWKKSPLTSFEG